ncbi:MAG: hydantoinase B/oxoprolinase family protein, partial [Dehalococcoidia bacterium]|nr:hydantoinase B/oxoprolinase family protein [Dehalococcoidia bacterium]
GARTYKDGIDTGGFLSSVSCAIANAETYEFRYPMLYLYRRQEPDTGGPGKYRGGVSMGTMYICHGVDEIPNKVIHGMGLRQPDSVGLNGGYPANTHIALIKRNTNVEKLLDRGELPQDIGQIEGKLEILPAMINTIFKKGDVYSGRGVGGGGYGDPIARNPALVAQDVDNNLVTTETALNIYGVSLNIETMQVNLEETKARRKEIKDQRMSWKQKNNLQALPGDGKKGKVVQTINEQLSVVDYEGHNYTCCRCGQIISPAKENYKEFASFNESPIQKAGPLVNEHKVGEDVYSFREYCCPDCLTLLDAEIALKDVPFLWDTQLNV